MSRDVLLSGGVRPAAWICLLSCGLLSLATRAGVLASVTRVVHVEGDPGHSLVLANTNHYPVVVQTWVDGGDGGPEGTAAPFVVLPAVFRLEPGALQGIRLLYNGDPLPRDRESVFWLNLHEIPPTGSQDDGRSRVVLAMNTQLKVFYRPMSLEATPDQLAGRLYFTLSHDGREPRLVCHNPTPLHASFSGIALSAGGQVHSVAPQVDMMTRPFESRPYAFAGTIPQAGSPRVRFTLLDDQGHPSQHEVMLFVR